MRDSLLCSMLRYYVSKHRNASILVPIGGIMLMQNLSKITGGRLFVMCGEFHAALVLLSFVLISPAGVPLYT